MESEERLQILLEAVFGPEGREFSADAGPGSVGVWDSVTHLNLILSIEAEFGVTFSSAELQDLNSLGKIRSRLQQI
jgi:acyl carrier protein